ncbi:bifunctional ADP-dependent NAD(P)H-hydrate dehydratase/NAD(P)H-hydrate epimerase, partial [Desulfovibrio oxamicus]
MTPTDNAARWHLPYIALPAPEEMAAWDRAASTDFGLREEILMENASREALHVLREELSTSVASTSANNGAPGTPGTPLPQRPTPLPFTFTGLRVLLFMGGGNNGGDAAALARHLHDAGAEVLVLHTRPLGGYRGAAGYHVRLAKRCGVPFRPAGA